MRKLYKFLTSKVLIVTTLILLQIILLMYIIFALAQYAVYLYGSFILLSIAITIWIINRPDNPSYKFAWCIPILLFPLFGGMFYLMFGIKQMPKKVNARYQKVTNATISLFEHDQFIMRHFLEEDKSIYKQVYYLMSHSYYPIYRNCENEFLPTGEAMFERMKIELRKAKKFIFIEYFIIAEGIFWNSILEILVEKVKEGVEVRLIYDDAGCLQTLPSNYHKTLEKLGIRVYVFNRLVPALMVHMNNRDHRKIVVIDGNVGFTGGINLADEYINAYVRFGHWKDNGIMIRGEAVWNFTIMLLQFWNLEYDEDEDYRYYRPDPEVIKDIQAAGFVLPYADTPSDDEIIGEFAHMNILNMAKEYVYIQTPYLICDNEVITALTLAAKNGIDVRMILPHIPDKWYVHIVTRAYYQPLIEAGVKIYEYTPGFMHAKTFICDDEVAIIGTTNMDYRSYYLHHECGIWMYKTESIRHMKEDFLAILAQSQRITVDMFKKESLATKVMRAILRVFAPLM